MGQEISVSPSVNIITSHIKHIDSNINKNNLIIKSKNISPRKQILSLTTTSTTSAKQNITSNNNVALIFCNSYYGTKYDLGDSAINDGLLCYQQFMKYNFETLMFYDVSGKEFKQKLALHLSKSYNKLIVYFIGHGVQTKDKQNDEKDNYDECLFFKDEKVLDDEIASIVNENNKCKNLRLIADCCHSGSIYDIPSREDIITISACSDSQTAKQDWIEHKGNGVFTYYFWKCLPKSNNDGKTLQLKINEKLKKYYQSCQFNFLTKEVI